MATIILNHPLIDHKLTIMRNKETGTKEFRQNLDEIAMLMAYEVTKSLPLQNIEIETPICSMTGKKLDKKMYYHHSGWLGGLKSKTARQFLEKDPVGFVESAVKGMLPHNTLGRKQGMKLFVYAGSEHPHAAQQPVELKIKG